MNGNRLAGLLREGRGLLGFYNGYPAEGILETIGPAWDFVWIDGQHGQFSIDTAMRAVRTASAIGLETLLRVPSHDPGLLGQYADTAASALMIPQVDTPQMATAVATALRFAPRGNRSIGGRRPVDVHGRDYFRICEPVVVAQIESRRALENVELISQIDGIDALFFGADDMKLSMGLPLETPISANDTLINAQRSIAAAAGTAGKSCGCGVADAADLRSALDMGYRLIAGGGDVRFLRAGSRQALDEQRCVLLEFQSQLNPKSSAARDK